MPVENGNSSPVISNQPAIHPDLDRVVLKHLDQPWRQPLHTPSVNAYHQLLELMPGEKTESIILDSGCGTGESSRRLAAEYPDSLVIGVDQSIDRLQRGGMSSLPSRQDNLLYCRADLTTFWRLAERDAWNLQAHYLLYPNPWPKAAHLKRRWHGHPVFPSLLALGGEIVLRTNWELYAREFHQALELAGYQDPGVCGVFSGQSLSAFERKYRASGHELFEVRALPAPESG